MKKIKFFLKILLIVIVIFIVAFSSKNKISYADFTIGGYTIHHIDDFKNYIRNNTYSFINASDNTFFGEEFTSDIYGGVSYLTEEYRYVTCLCHPINRPAEEVWRRVVDVFTIKYENGGYVITHNGRTLNQPSSTIGKINIPKLAYLIEYQSNVPSDGKNMNYTAPGNVALAETFYDMRVKSNTQYANYANDNVSGVAFINVSNSQFFQSDTGHFYMTHSDSEDSDGAANQSKALQLLSSAQRYGNEALNYKELSKKSTYFNAEKQDSDYIIGPLKVDYGGKGVNSITIKANRARKNATIYWSKNKYGNWSRAISDIPSNEEFYLKISSTEPLENKDIDVTINQESMEIYTAK